MTAVDYFEERFGALGSAARAASAKAYMKSSLRFHGVDAKQLRAECKAYCARASLDREALVENVDALIATDGFELRSAAIALLEANWKLLDPSDLHWLVEIGRTTACWAHVDFLASAVIENVLERYVDPSDEAELVRTWGSDPDSFWVRRIGLLAQLRRLRHGGGDFALFASIAVPLLAEKEFFIRKAIGWVLREVTKKRPALVEEFCLAHARACSGLTWREATKYLPPAMKKRVDAARR